MRNANNARLTTTKSETMFGEILNAIEDSLSILACPDKGKHGKGKDNNAEDPVLGKLKDDDEPGCVMNTYSIEVQHWMERCQSLLMMSE